MYDDYYMDRAEVYIDKLEDDLEVAQTLNRQYVQQIMSLEQEIDNLRAQIQNLTRYLE